MSQLYILFLLSSLERLRAIFFVAKMLINQSYECSSLIKLFIHKSIHLEEVLIIVEVCVDF